jgi:hypothetical protein
MEVDTRRSGLASLEPLGSMSLQRKPLASRRSRDIEGVWDRERTTGDVVHLIIPCPGLDSTVGLLKRDFATLILNNGRVLDITAAEAHLSPRAEDFCRLLLEGYKGSCGDIAGDLKLLQGRLQHHLEQLPFDGMMPEERREQVREYLVNGLSERIELKRPLCHGFAALGAGQVSGDETTLRHIKFSFQSADPPLKVEVDVHGFLEDIDCAAVKSRENPQDASMSDGQIKNVGTSQQDASSSCSRNLAPLAAAAGENLSSHVCSCILDSLLPVQIDSIDMGTCVQSPYAVADAGTSALSMVLPRGPAGMPGKRAAQSLQLVDNTERRCSLESTMKILLVSNRTLITKLWLHRFPMVVVLLTKCGLI